MASKNDKKVKRYQKAPVSSFKGQRVIASKGGVTNYRVNRLIAYCALGILARTLSGLLGVGGGVILGPLFLDLGIPPEVSSATTILIMTFSSSTSVRRGILPSKTISTLYFAALSTISAILGQTMVGKLIHRSGRTSVIIFIMASMMVTSAIALGGVGIAHAIENIRRREYM
ncbi:hypothetical protein L484_025516 [Morus notabilis]|uniref:Sulfite exporter TauE/SafE family protein n=1 Tax=Morus notabilis TaxID=981085 RepID=W9RZK1_9ROSA|nr:hypothetical protein L484_025516 [Morus notabilis]